MDYLNILWIFLLSLGINAIFFVFAFVLKTDKFTDITYSAIFLIIMVVLISWHKSLSFGNILIFIGVSLWAIRLGTSLFTRIMKLKVDPRFDKIRNSFVKFSGFWLLQAISVFVIVLPAASSLVTVQSDFISTNLKYVDVLWFLIFLLGLGIETSADLEKSLYYKNKTKKSPPFLMTGTWKISRHPNYLGEIILWWAISALFLYDTLLKQVGTLNHNAELLKLLYLLCPLYITLLLMFVSGVPTVEPTSWKKYHKLNVYLDYINKTPIIFPIIGQKGKYRRIK